MRQPKCEILLHLHITTSQRVPKPDLGAAVCMPRRGPLVHEHPRLVNNTIGHNAWWLRPARTLTRPDYLY